MMLCRYHFKWLLMLFLSLTQTNLLLASEERLHKVSLPLNAQALVSQVLTANPQLEVAQATWQASIARIDQASALEDPQLNYTMAPMTIGGQSNYGQRIEISQKLPWLGKLDLRNATASHKAEAEQHKIAILQLQLSGSAKTLFADWYFVHQASAINQAEIILLTELRTLSMNRYSTGEASKQATLQVAVSIALLEHKAIALERERRSIRTRINTLLNQQPNHPIAEPSELMISGILPEIGALQEQALQARPELKALDAAIKAAKSNSELALKNNYPDINLNAGYNSLWDNSDKHFTVGVGVNLPLYQGKHRAEESEALALRKQAEWMRIDFIAQLKEEVQIAYDRVHESQHILGLYKDKLLPLAKETVQTAQSDYQAGKGDFLTLIDSEKNHLQTQLQVEQALTNTYKRLAELESAVGSFAPLTTTFQTNNVP
ncbi:MAG: TolC family protein [Methyloprofundus sp.]|nr:TolC family protein [Methyloprofundus sp.]MDT8426142.1 TolC family protein [Methyloprofundus sp.]